MPDQNKHSPRPGLDRLVHGKTRRGGGAGYSRFVKAMRILLPLAALGLFAILLAWPEFDSKVDIATRQIEVTSENVKNELVNPRFEGVDDQQRPYTITASRAIQSEEDPNLVNLEDPVADITLSTGEWLAAEAQTGLYNQGARRLELERNVFVFYDEGYELTTESLLVDMKERKITSKSEVKGKGPKGQLEAKSMRANADENVLFFEGPARLVLYTQVTGL